jgi:DNA processing protein
MPSIIAINQRHPYYPRRLLDLSDPPKEIYCLGDLRTLNNYSFAVVGSRKASQLGLRQAHYFSKTLALKGFCIVSGLAEGIDSAAHRGALNSKLEHPTIAVCGTGLDICYPKHNQHLFNEILQNGLLLSEYPPGSPIKPFHFPRRNRLIAALSIGTLVVEATIKSGSLISAKQAANLGREVFAIPRSIEEEGGQGCHYLIQQGAKLTQNISDILDELKPYGHLQVHK